jgi:hypothetical protein
VVIAAGDGARTQHFLEETSLWRAQNNRSIVLVYAELAEAIAAPQPQPSVRIDGGGMRVAAVDGDDGELHLHAARAHARRSRAVPALACFRRAPHEEVAVAVDCAKGAVARNARDAHAGQRFDGLRQQLQMLVAVAELTIAPVAEGQHAAAHRGDGGRRHARGDGHDLLAREGADELRFINATLQIAQT